MFSLETQRGKKNIVLYFYPKNDTPGCTMEANEFTDLDENFIRFDTLAVGVSRDECLSHAEFRDKYGLSVLLLSDKEAMVCKKYGVLYDKEACIDRTTDKTTSHLTGETTSHSTRLSKNDNQVAGYRQPKNSCQVIGYEHGRSVDGYKKVAMQRSTFVIDKQDKLRLHCTVSTRTVMPIKFLT